MCLEQGMSNLAMFPSRLEQSIKEIMAFHTNEAERELARTALANKLATHIRIHASFVRVYKKEEGKTF